MALGIEKRFQIESVIMASTNDIRDQFLSFFGEDSHEIVPSAPLVPINDPTLLFTNAGMVPFKNVFTGAENRSYQRATSSQKCVRAGGKHNDLDNVGYTARHHTFFEMLGNFSFGDYFKDHAIEQAWTLVTKDYGLDASNLLVTVYHEDDEAAALWKKIAGLSDDRIIRIATSDNFWSMGDTGPCGPCSEIFYDHGDDIAGGPPGSPDEDGDRFIEIWNLVFMQYNQKGPGVREDLPRPSIDTGMGLERIAAVLQGQHDNYDIDTFRRLIDASVQATGAEETADNRASHRIIADHLRASSFLIADGVLPSNEGRGYVLRRIMRRAMRHGHILGAKDLVLNQLVSTLVQEMGKAFPELGRAEALITETLKLEETKFRSLLERGTKQLDAEVAKLADGSPLPGDVAFALYDTCGFPLDLTQDAMRQIGRTVDVDGFNAAMEEQRARARAAWKGSGDNATDELWFDLREQHGATEFVGYASETAEGQIVAIVKDGSAVDTVEEGEDAIILCNQTPFYGESGGQMGDSGLIKRAGCNAVVSDTQKPLGALHTHYVSVDKGGLSVGDVVSLTVDGTRRSALRAHHSATHLLHEALRRKLGEHVTQKGSLVAPDRLRFDFAHPKAVRPDEIRHIERDVNARIRGNDAVETQLMNYDAAVDSGAMALFGEKYDEEVRVLFMGAEGEKKERSHFSIELCGGTHVNRLGDIGAFVVLGESAVASGVRRIEAAVGDAALDHLFGAQDALQSVAGQLKASTAETPARIDALLKERKQLEKDLSDARKKAATGGGAAEGPAVKTVGTIPFLGQVLDGVPTKDLRGLADESKQKLGSAVIAYVSVVDGKAAVVTTVTKDLLASVDAVSLARLAAEALGGKGGGGRPDMAQAGGPDGEKAHAAIAMIEAKLASL